MSFTTGPTMEDPIMLMTAAVSQPTRESPASPYRPFPRTEVRAHGEVKQASTRDVGLRAMPSIYSECGGSQVSFAHTYKKTNEVALTEPINRIKQHYRIRRMDSRPIVLGDRRLAVPKAFASRPHPLGADYLVIDLDSLPHHERLPAPREGIRDIERRW